MSLSLAAAANAIAPGLNLSFLASGGMEPYAYSVIPGGAGGTIDPVTGIYTAPLMTGSDTIRVTDSLMQVDQLTINVGLPLQLLCDIIQTQMGLSPGRVYLWKQKWFQPKDSDLYIAVGIISLKPFGNNQRLKAGLNLTGQLSVNTQAMISIDIMSRGKAARERKEEVLSALNSDYARSQQERNSFNLAVIPTGFLDLSEIDGTAYPYRFNLSIAMQYFSTVTKGLNYFDTFQTPSILTNQ